MIGKKLKLFKMSFPSRTNRKENKNAQKKTVRFQTNRGYFNLDGSKVSFGIPPGVYQPLPYHRLDKLFHSTYILHDVMKKNIENNKWYDAVSEVLDCNIDTDIEQELVQKEDAVIEEDISDKQKETLKKDFDSLYKRLTGEVNNKSKTRIRQGGKLAQFQINKTRLAKKDVAKAVLYEPDNEEEYNRIGNLLPYLFKKFDPKVDMKHIKEAQFSSSESDEEATEMIFVKQTKRNLTKNEVFAKELHEYLELIKKRDLKLINENDTKYTSLVKKFI
jgi:hypothetical protein